MSTYIDSGLEIEYLLNPLTNHDDGSDIVSGLTQSPKSLPPRYFYDQKGSQLFEQICQLPEYYPTRTETAILQKCAAEIAQITGACELIELGSGSSTKTHLILDAYQNLGYGLQYIPIDVSSSILELSARRLLTDYPKLKIHGLVSTYELALQSLKPSNLPGRMTFFLGSSLGNFSDTECDRFFAQITTALQPGDYFLLGIDLQKPTDILEAAYNDTQGVTAAFNLNMLAHLNWRFGANFNLDYFQHQAIYNVAKSQIEMYLISQRSHLVNFQNLDLNIKFTQQEPILTEISRKFNLETMVDYLEIRGLKCLKFWSDNPHWFSLLLTQLN